MAQCQCGVLRCGSTVCLDEGIVELADFCGAGQAVAEWKTKQLSQFLGYVSCLAYNIFQKTNLGLISLRAMTGTVPFDEALAAWISLSKPSLSQVEDRLEKRPPRISQR